MWVKHNISCREVRGSHMLANKLLMYTNQTKVTSPYRWLRCALCLEKVAFPATVTPSDREGNSPQGHLLSDLQCWGAAPAYPWGKIKTYGVFLAQLLIARLLFPTVALVFLFHLWVNPKDHFHCFHSEVGGLSSDYLPPTFIFGCN